MNAAYLAPGSNGNREIALELFGSTTDAALAQARDAYAAITARDPYTAALNPDQPVGSKLDYYSASATLNYELADNASLRSITAYRHFATDRMLDFDGTPYKLIYTLNKTNQNQFTQELQLNGDFLEKRLKYSVGFYYYKTTGFDGGPSASNSLVNPVVTTQSAKLSTESPAFYGQATFAVTPSINFTGGLRWTSEKKTGNLQPSSFDPRTNVTTCQVAPIFRIGICDSHFKTSAQNLSYTAGIDWKPVEDVMLYVKTSKGFKGGGVQQRISANPASTVPFAPEIVQDYEAGLKTEFFDRHARFNVALFHSSYDNIQRTINLATATGPVQTIRNAAKATIKGFEAEFTATPFDGLLFTAGTAHTLARYKQYASNGVDLSDQPFQNVPKWSYNLSGSYGREIGIGKLTGQLDYSWQSLVHLAPTGVGLMPESIEAQRAYGLLNASVTLVVPSIETTIRGYVKNIFDKEYFAGENELVSAGIGISARLPGAPRMFAIEITKSF
jgi:iron complex outermembrane receptor protein